MDHGYYFIFCRASLALSSALLAFSTSSTPSTCLAPCLSTLCNASSTHHSTALTALRPSSLTSPSQNSRALSHLFCSLLKLQTKPNATTAAADSVLKLLAYMRPPRTEVVPVVLRVWITSFCARAW